MISNINIIFADITTFDDLSNFDMSFSSRTLTLKKIFAKLKFSPVLLEKNTIICLLGV